MKAMLRYIYPAMLYFIRLIHCYVGPDIWKLGVFRFAEDWGFVNIELCKAAFRIGQMEL